MRKYPVNGDPVITAKFSKDKYAPHCGVDLAVAHRTSVFSLTNGEVIKLQSGIKKNWLANTSSDPYKPFGFPTVKRKLRNEDYGNFVKIDHGSGISTLYAHLDEVVVHNGQQVKEGELIGYSDNTGNSTGNHIHYEVRIKDMTTDPITFYESHKDFEGKGGVEEGNFYPYTSVVTVRPEVDILYVRSGPTRLSSLAGSQKLKRGDTVSVVGFVKGERIDYPNIANTQYWWKSTKGNYFWAGGTNLIPSLNNFPEGMKYIVESSKKEKLMEELKKLIEDLESRKQEIVDTINEKEGELDGVEMEIESKKKELEEMETAEPTPEEAVEEAVEAEEIEEVAVEEVAEAEAEEPEEKKEAKDLLKTIMEKFGISKEDL